MRWLFAIFLLSLCVLLWAAFAIARHIRRASQRPQGEAWSASEHDVAQHPASPKDEERAALPQDVR